MGSRKWVKIEDKQLRVGVWGVSKESKVVVHGSFVAYCSYILVQ